MKWIDNIGRQVPQLAYGLVWTCLLGVATAWMWSCTGAEVEPGTDRPTGEQLRVEIPVAEVPLQRVDAIDTKSALAPATKAPTYKRAIVLQYDTNGALQNTGKTDIDNYTIGTSISAQLVAAANCNIYVLVVNETGTTGATYTTEANFKAATYALYTKFPAPTSADIPLVGSLSGVAVESLNSSVGDVGVIKDPTAEKCLVKLSRIAAELNISFTYQVPGFKIDPATATLNNVPTAFYLLDQTGTTFPAEGTAAAFTTATSAPLTGIDGDATTPAANTWVRFVPTNRRGSNNNIAYPKDKFSGNVPKTTTDRCTHLAFTAVEKAKTTHRLTYSYYFGGNTTSNFDVLRNHVYRMNSTILQRSEGDRRITEAGVAPLVRTEPTAASVSSSGATISGSILDKCGSAITSYGFYYKKDAPFANPANPTTDGTKVAKGTDNIAIDTKFTHPFASLATNTAVYFCAYATSANGTSYGAMSVFTTQAAGLPVLNTLKDLTSSSYGTRATSTGNTVTGGSTLGVVYSTNKAFNHLTEGTRVNGTLANGTYSITLAGLTPGTTYYYRYFASNAVGYVYSNASISFYAYPGANVIIKPGDPNTDGSNTVFDPPSFITPEDPNADNSTIIFDMPILDLAALYPTEVKTRDVAFAHRAEINAQTASNSALVSPMGIAASGPSGTWNAKMSPKIQVMRANHATSGTDWAAAYNWCKTYSGEGGTAGEWRLPTYKELKKIYENQSSLQNKGGYTAFNAANYWSSTEGSANLAWELYFVTGNSYSSSGKPNLFTVRCVRDL